MAQVFVCSKLEMKDGDVRIVRQDRIEVGVYRMPAPTTPIAISVCIRAVRPAKASSETRSSTCSVRTRRFLGQTYDENEPHIVCPWHGWEYKLKTGECAPDPKLRLKRHEVVQREGGIYVVI